MNDKQYHEDASQRIDELNKKLEPLQDGLKGAREKLEPLYDQRRDIMDERRELRAKRRECLKNNDTEAAGEVVAKIEKQDVHLNDLEKKINAIESEIDSYERDIQAIKYELEDLMDDYSPQYSKSKGFYININGKDLGKEFNKAVDKLSEINFDEVGETIGRAVDKAVNGINRGITNFIHDVKHNPESGDYFFSGSASLPGGDYGRLNFTGTGHLLGDTKCSSLRASGSLACDGSIDCSGDIRSSGTVKCSGNVSANALKTSGSVKINGGFEGKSIFVSGSLTVGADIKADSVRTGGSVTVGGDCEAEEFFSAGKLNIGGLLNADEIEISLGGISNTVSSIGCESITITRRHLAGVLHDLGIKGAGGCLVTDSIEGDVIHLENTTAKIVRGKDVYIGDGCDIEIIEYSNKCEISGNSKIGDTKHV